MTTHFRGQGKRTTFAPDSVTLQTDAGRLLQTRPNPRSSFSGQVLDSPWDELHVAYFNSNALWTYLTVPFRYTFPGFETEELPAWHEDGEIWRRLCVSFPNEIASHGREQISVDYAVVYDGEIWLELDEAETLHLKGGDVVVQNGARHAWTNKGTNRVTMLFP